MSNTSGFYLWMALVRDSVYCFYIQLLLLFAYINNLLMFNMLLLKVGLVIFYCSFICFIFERFDHISYGYYRFDLNLNLEGRL